MVKITVREMESGDFNVVVGGEIYRTWNGRQVPGSVKAGETVSAAEVCDWLASGAEVRDDLTVAQAALFEYGAHAFRCNTQRDPKWDDRDLCDCGFNAVRKAVFNTNP